MDKTNKLWNRARFGRADTIGVDAGKFDVLGARSYIYKRMSSWSKHPSPYSIQQRHRTARHFQQLSPSSPQVRHKLWLLPSSFSHIISGVKAEEVELPVSGV